MNTLELIQDFESKKHVAETALSALAIAIVPIVNEYRRLTAIYPSEIRVLGAWQIENVRISGNKILVQVELFGGESEDFIFPANIFLDSDWRAALIAYVNKQTKSDEAARKLRDLEDLRRRAASLGMDVVVIDETPKPRQAHPAPPRPMPDHPPEPRKVIPLTSGEIQHIECSDYPSWQD
jgi:hypothetical protein